MRYRLAAVLLLVPLPVRAAESKLPPGPGEPPPDKPTGSKAVSFQMQREGGDWVFAQTDYLQLKVDNLGP